MFENSQAETKTTTEKGFVEGFAKQIGDIGSIMIAILAAVLFTLLLVVGNTMAQSVRERTSELAVLKTLGFTDVTVLSLVLAESLFVAVVGGGLGLRLAWLFVQQGDPTGGLLPVFYLPARDLVLGVVLMVALGVLGRHRCRRPAAMRLKITDALRRRRPMSWFTQIFSVTCAEHPHHPRAARLVAVAVVGIAGVVIVFVAVLSIAEGFSAAMQRPARRPRASSCAAAPTAR